MSLSKVKIINRIFPIERFFEIFLNKRVDNNKNIRCMFHRDRKPSARVYGNAVWCFDCGRFFYISNFMYLLKLDVDVVFNKLLEIYDLSGIEDEDILFRRLLEIYNEKGCVDVRGRRRFLRNIKGGDNKDFINFSLKFFGG